MSDSVALANKVTLAIGNAIESAKVPNTLEGAAAVQVAMAAVSGQLAANAAADPAYVMHEYHKQTNWHLQLLMQINWLSLPLAEQGEVYSYRIAVGRFTEALFVRLVARDTVAGQEGQDAAAAMLEAFGLIYGGVYCNDLLNALSAEARDSFHSRLREAIEVAAMRVRKDFEALVPGVSVPRGDLN